VYPTCPGKQAGNDLIYEVTVCTFEGMVTGVSYKTSNKGYEAAYDMCMVDEPNWSAMEGNYLEDAYTYYSKDGADLRKKAAAAKSGDVAVAGVDGSEGEGEPPAGWECKTRVMCEGEVITRTQVRRRGSAGAAGLLIVAVASRCMDVCLHAAHAYACASPPAAYASPFSPWHPKVVHIPDPSPARCLLTSPLPVTRCTVP
jgi:hypothetical protein